MGLVHPCDKPSNGDCEQICIRVGESNTCFCEEPDYKLNADGKKCDKGIGLTDYAPVM